MRIQAIVAHPRTTSFCYALFEKAVTAIQSQGHDVIVHDLYAEGFDPVLKADEAFTVGDSEEEATLNSTDPVVNRHRAEIKLADGLLVVHPNWWGKPPAILAGWLDRVLVPGVAYKLHTAEGEPDGLLSLNTALVLNTSDTPKEREDDVLGDPLNLMWGNCVLPFCGVKNIDRRMFGAVAGSDITQRQTWLAEVEILSNKCFPARS